MDKREIREILAGYADRLVRPGTSSASATSRHEQIQDLLKLAEQLQAVLLPVAPEANYRRRLHGDLILEAQRRQAEPQAGLFQQHRKGILIGAAIGSLASVVGVLIAFVLHYRHGRANIAAG